MLALIACFLIPKAPMPFKKPPPPIPAIVPGVYVMEWQTVPCETSFHKDGFYACNWHGNWWHGHWRQEKGILYVEEWPIDQPLRRHRWEVEIKCSQTGILSKTHKWMLKRPHFKIR